MSSMQAPRHALFSGYSMFFEYFMKLACALGPEFAAYARQVPTELVEYVFEYDCWRRRLSAEDRARAPIPKVLRTEANNLGQTDGDESETKIFFSTRWVPLEDSVDPARQEDSPPEEDTEADRVQRDELIALIKQTSGFSVDRGQLQFETTKDVHPSRDPMEWI